MTQSQIVTFVVDKELDKANHLKALNSYKRNKKRGFQQQTNDNLEKLSKIESVEEIQASINRTIEKYYAKEEKLLSLVNDINAEWAKIENEFFIKLEEIHKFPFPFTSVKGVLSSASRFGYDKQGNWFAMDMFRNKFIAIDIAMHELMHFMFHKYYDQVCEERGLTKDQMWDVKEAFTVLLNLEFDNLRFQQDNGYAPHAKLREVIKASWEKNRDFNKALDEAIAFVKS